MNILMALSQRELTGAEVFAVTIANELIARGHKVIIVSDTLTAPTKAEFIPLAFNDRFFPKRIMQVRTMVQLIRQHDIQVVHSHSRASAYISALACSLCGIPHIASIHGRQPVHLSRVLLKCAGELSLCVCESIRNQVITDLSFNPEHTLILRNPVSAQDFTFCPPALPPDATSTPIPSAAQPLHVALIGRLSGPKGWVVGQVLEQLKDHPEIKIDVVGGKAVSSPEDLPEFLRPYAHYQHIQFKGYCADIPNIIKHSDVIIGAGRVGIETLMSGRPLIAIGEGCYHGLVTQDNVAAVMSTNFGDITSTKQGTFTFERLLDDLHQAQVLGSDHAQLQALREQVLTQYDAQPIVDQVEHLYSRVYVHKTKRELPVIMYHRVIKDDSEKGIHGTYIEQERFRANLQYLKDHGYETVTFDDLRDGRYKKRFDRDHPKWIILTFDDGYVDNYTTAFPLLKEFGFKAVIFLLSHRDYNAWDADDPQHPEKKLPLMTKEMVDEMAAYGIEFGAHTKTHPRLAELPPKEARAEITECKAALEHKYGRSFKTFAYPYGSLNEDIKTMVKESGFDFAVATDSGDVVFDADLFQIRRIAIFPKNSMLTFKRKASGYYNFIKLRREARKAKQAQSAPRS